VDGSRRGEIMSIESIGILFPSSRNFSVVSALITYLRRTTGLQEGGAESNGELAVACGDLAVEMGRPLAE